MYSCNSYAQIHGLLCSQYGDNQKCTLGFLSRFITLVALGQLKNSRYILSHIDPLVVDPLVAIINISLLKLAWRTTGDIEQFHVPKSNRTILKLKFHLLMPHKLIAYVLADTTFALYQCSFDQLQSCYGSKLFKWLQNKQTEPSVTDQQQQCKREVHLLHSCYRSKVVLVGTVWTGSEAFSVMYGAKFIWNW